MPSLELIGRPVVIDTLSCQLKEQPAWPRLLALSTSGAFCEKSLRQDSLYPVYTRRKVSHRGPFIIRAQYHNGFRTQHLAHTKRSGSTLAARGRSHSLTLDYIGRWNGGGETLASAEAL